MEEDKKTNKPQFINVDFPNFSVVLCSYGASVYSIKVDGHEMISTFKDKDAWLNDNSYHGKTVGRVAGRIPYASIDVGNRIYRLEPNERGNCLHGGFKGLSFRNFESIIYQYLTYYEVVYSYHSPDMECGFPGDVDFEITYKVYKDKTIEIFHKATSKVLTPVNLTQHLYFNLGDKDLYNISMMVNAKKRYLLDNNLLKKDLVDVKGTSYDFREPKLVLKDSLNEDVVGPYKNGFDDIWYLGKTDKRDVSAYIETYRYRAEFYTNYDAVVIYMNGYPSKQMLNTDVIEETHSAITMEFTNGDVQYVSAGKPYNKYTKIKFKEIIDGKR